MTTQEIINKHSGEITAGNYAKKIEAAGGFAAYVRSLGGIFAELIGRADKITTAAEFRRRCDYVQGLMQIFRFCYWNGKTWHWYKGSAATSFYSTKQTKTCPTGTVEQLASGAGGRTRITNCNYGVDTLAKKIGQNIWSCDYDRMINAGAKKVTNRSQLRAGDLVHFFDGSVTKKNWRHVAIVYSVSGGKIILADFGRRFITTGKPLHVFPDDYSNYGANWFGVHWIDLEEKAEAVPMLNGIDVSSFQSGIDLAKVPGDFVIVKTTQGTWYTNPDWKRQAESAVKAGKLLGLYHYGEGKNAKAEAAFFLAAARPYIGRAVLAYDWERTDNALFGSAAEIPFVNEFMKAVRDASGVWPLLYIQQSEVLARNWEPVAKNCGLWLAQYVVQQRNGYTQALSHGTTGAWDYPAIWQYTSGGYLSGYAARLDLNVAYMSRDAWAAYAKAKTAAPTPAQKEEDVDMVPRTVKYGSTGAAVRMLQGYLNIKVDGKALKQTADAIGDYQKKHKDIDGKPLKVDKVCGPKTWRSIIKTTA